MEFDLFTIDRPAAEEAYDKELIKAEYSRKLKESYCKVPLLGGKLSQSTAFECHGVNVRAITAPLTLTITREVALIINRVCV